MGEALVWWLTIEILGLITLPLAWVLMRALPDRGYALSKILSILLVGWLGYTLAMIKILPFGQLSIALCAVVVLALSIWLLVRKGRSLASEFSAHYRTGAALRYVITAEVLFALAFISWAVIRAYNPDIIDQEKYMDFGFLNAILKSPSFPPNDMWLAGYSINYYYFGYVLIAAITALSGVPTQVAFNLANVTLFALTALGSFGIVYNLISGTLLRRAARSKTHHREATARRSRTREAVEEPVAQVAVPTLPSRQARTVRTRSAAAAEESAVAVAERDDVATAATVNGNGRDDLPARPARRNGGSPAYLPGGSGEESRHVSIWLSPYIYAVLAALMVVAMGNLTTMFAAKTGDTLQGNGYVFCFACNGGDGYNWFGASRIVQDYVTGADGVKQKVGFETINEFPAFSFLLADMHPHVLALPLVLLTIGVALGFARRRVLHVASWRDGIPPGLHAWFALIIAAILVGSLYTTNTWDYPTYLIILLGALVIPYLTAQRRTDNPRGWSWLKPWLLQSAFIVVLSLVAFIPFHLTFKSLVGGQPAEVPANIANIPVMGWVAQKLATLLLVNTADKTILGFVVIFGVFLFSILVWLGYEFVALLRRRAQITEGQSRTPVYWAIFFVLVFLAAFLLKFPLLALLLPMAVVSLYILWQQPGRPERNMALLMVAVGALIGLVIEVVFLRDNFQMRMNTLFKFYFQLWILFALAAGYGLWKTLYAAFGERNQDVRSGAKVYETSPVARALSVVWAGVMVLAVLSGCMYSVYGVKARQIGNQTAMRGLDGTTWLNNAAPGDYEVVNWLKSNASGSNRVLEAGSDEYQHGPGRISSYSGIPTLISWDNSHEDLWRTNQPDARAQIRERRNVVNSIYKGVSPTDGTNLSAQQLVDLLHQYKVDYVVVGATELGQGDLKPSKPEEQTTPYGEGLIKQALPVAFAAPSGNATVYRVSQGVEGAGGAPATPSSEGSTQPTVAATIDPNAPAVDLFSRSPAGAGKGQLNMPRGIARDPAGNFFVADTQNLRIEKYDKDGKFVTAFGGKGSGEGQFNPINDEGQGTGPGGIAVDKDGNVFVADTWNHRIEKFDNSGKFLMSWGSFVNIGDPTMAADTDKDTRFYGPRGLAIGPDNNLYITDTGNKRVLIFDTSGKFVRKIDSGETPDKTAPTYPFDKPGELNEPIGIAVDTAGDVYVADTLNKRIQKFDPTGKPVAQWPVPGNNWEIGPFLEPFLALDKAGNLYTTAPTGKAVLKFGPDGTLLEQARGEGDVQLQTPTGITVDEDGNVHVVDTGLNSVFNLGQVP